MKMVKSIVPEGACGDWCVEKFEVDARAAQLDELRAAFNPHRTPRPVAVGRYTRLRRSGVVVMSDTPSEIDDHREFIRHANGHVLVNGLGLGVCLQMLLAKENVESVTVVELSRNVINLVWPSFKHDPRASINLACAFTWKPPKGQRYNAVWHDVWDTISADNLPEMHKLHRKYGRRADWQDSWCRYECERAP